MTAQSERSGEDDGTGAGSPTADTVLEDILTSPCAASGGGDVYMAHRVTRNRQKNQTSIQPPGHESKLEPSHRVFSQTCNKLVKI